LAAQKHGIEGNASQSAHTKPKKTAATSLDDVIDDDDNYPKIGPGYTDEVSVVSDMTTPTVMTKQKVLDEEHYREVKGGQGALTPMHQSSAGGVTGGRPSRTVNRSAMGGGKPAGAGKTKNMVGQVRPVAPRPPVASKSGAGGAAAQRRLNYQMAMNKLESTGFGQAMEPISPTPSRESRKSTESKKSTSSPTRTSSAGRSTESGSGGGGNRRHPRKKTDNIDWGMTDENGWPTFDNDTNKSGKNELILDSDGFFTQNQNPSNDGSDGVTPQTNPTRRKKSDGVASSGSKKKSSREDRGNSRKPHRSKREKDRDGAENTSDHDKVESSRKPHRVKKDKDGVDVSSDHDKGSSSRKPHRVKKERDRDGLGTSSDHDRGNFSKKTHRSRKEKDRDGLEVSSDHERGSSNSKKTHRSRRDKDNAQGSSDTTRRNREKEKSSGRRKPRRQSMPM